MLAILLYYSLNTQRKNRRASGQMAAAVKLCHAGPGQARQDLEAIQWGSKQADDPISSPGQERAGPAQQTQSGSWQRA